MNNSSKSMINLFLLIASIGSTIIFILTFVFLDGYYESKAQIINGKFYVNTDVSKQLDLPKNCINNWNIKEIIKKRYEDRGNKDFVLIKELVLKWNSDDTANSPLNEIVECIVTNHQVFINDKNASIPFDDNEEFSFLFNKRSDFYLDNLKNNNYQDLNYKYIYINDYQNETDKLHASLGFNLFPNHRLYKYLNNAPTYQLGLITHKQLFSNNKLIQYSLIYCLNFIILLFVFFLIINNHFSKNKSS